jgi:imidazolonepropionase
MHAPPQSIDLLLTHTSEVATPIGRRALAGAHLGRIDRIPGGAVAIDQERIVDVGPAEALAERYRPRQRFDCRGGLLVPGLIDAHTHAVFAGSRELDFELRNRGASYAELARAGGGILSTVQRVRAASEEELISGLLVRLDRFLEHGTTTIECKSGYGLSREGELKCLRAMAGAARQHPVELVPTFLGAHAYPPEYAADRPAYVDLICEQLLPEVAAAGLARYADVFTEQIAFSLADSRRILERARSLGLGLRLHVEQLSNLGGAELAAELGAASADHLEHISPAGIEALARAGVQPVLCPLVPIYLRESQEAPGRRLVEADLAPALSTDFNPGSCPLQSLPEVLTFAALRYGYSAAEALTAATLNAAATLGRAADLGSIEPGKQADLVLFDHPNLEHLVYEFGRNAVAAVWKRGRLALQRTPFQAERRAQP